MLNQEKLKRLYFLNDNGNFIGKTIGRKNYGKVAGNRDKGIMIDGVNYSLVRLKTLYRTGVLPVAKAPIKAEATLNNNDAMRDIMTRRLI